MRYLAVLIATVLLAACSTAPVTHSESGAPSAAQVLAPDLQEASIDSVEQFLLAAAAADFHTHGPTHVVRFRNVRMGHVAAPTGNSQYFLCGEFLSGREGGEAGWTPFATIKTSGYEQWIGAQAARFYRDSSAVWDKTDDLSSALQTRFDSLR